MIDVSLLRALDRKGFLLCEIEPIYVGSFYINCRYNSLKNWGLDLGCLDTIIFIEKLSLEWLLDKAIETPSPLKVRPIPFFVLAVDLGISTTVF